MIPSDHFVRFYNEVFKFLEKKGDGELEKYWLTISEHQELHCLELFKKKGLKGMYEYWEHIRIEENCDMTLELTDDCLTINMHKCPSLSKVLDCDASACKKYCDHCNGWIKPLINKAGFYLAYDIIDRKIPKCSLYVFSNKNKAEEKKEKLLSENAMVL